jgi:hypothetical protein
VDIFPILMNINMHQLKQLSGRANTNWTTLLFMRIYKINYGETDAYGSVKFYEFYMYILYCRLIMLQVGCYGISL